MLNVYRAAAAVTWLTSSATAQVLLGTQERLNFVTTRDDVLQFYPSNPSLPDLNVASCKSITQCLIDYPQQLGSSDPDSFDIGLIVNIRYLTRPGDHTCASGNCLILNPSHLCNALGPHCLPIHNLRQPLTPCDPSNPYCTPGGFIIDLEVSCHPLDTRCGPGGVLVNPKPCQHSKYCPTGTFIPNWIEIHGGGGFNVTGPLLPQSYFPSISDHSREPGYLIDPTLICPSSFPECQPGRWLVIRPDRECYIGQPGCVGASHIRNPRYPNLPSSLCPSGGCMVIPIDTSCHPNDFECLGIAVDPVPCPIGARDCHNGYLQPPPFHRCRAGQPGCYNGIFVLPPPTLPPTDPPPPQRPSLLVPDYEGAIRCSYVEIDHLRPKRPETPVSPPQPAHYDAPDPLIAVNPDHGAQQPPVQPPAAEHPIPEPPSPPPQRAPEPEPPQQVVPPAQPPPPPEPPKQEPPKEEPPKPAAPPAPQSKFPCSKSDSDPCRGKIIRGWVAGANYWDWNGEHAKPNMPKRTTLGDKNFNQDTILEVVDSWFNNAHYTIWIDGEVAGESDEKELMNNKVSCSGGDDCTKKGFSHAWIFIPKGQHKVEVGQTSGFVNGDSDRPYTYGFTQFQTRLHVACDASNCPS